MKPSRRFWAPLAAMLFPVLAYAHPGHDHADIPSVIRHPFAGIDHMLITAAVLLVAGAAMLTGARLFTATRGLRWIGAGCVVAGAALTLI